MSDPTDGSPPGSSVHGILQARIREGVAVPSSRGSSRPRDGTHDSGVSCTGRRVLHRLSRHLLSGLSPRSLGNCGLTAAACQDLASALNENQSLTHLCLSGDELGSEGMSLLCRAVKLPSCGLQKLA